MPRMIICDAPGIATLSVTPGDPSTGEGRASVTPRWQGMIGLRSAAIHGAIGADTSIEYAQWEDEGTGRGGRAATAGDTVYYARTLHIRAGPRHPGGALQLVVDSEQPRPTLIGIFKTTESRHAALIAYIREAAAKLAEAVDGWIGAVLLQSLTGYTVIEYLQFESMDFVASTQQSPVIAAHQARLAELCSLEIGLYLPRAVYGGDGTGAAAAHSERR